MINLDAVPRLLFLMSIKVTGNRYTFVKQNANGVYITLDFPVNS